jgi:hypothetical protein
MSHAFSLEIMLTRHARNRQGVASMHLFKMLPQWQQMQQAIIEHSN